MPAPTSSLNSSLTTPGSRPSAFSSSLALAGREPDTSGTFTVCGPSETVSVTESFLRILAPGFGSVPMTVPRSTVSL